MNTIKTLLKEESLSVRNTFRPKYFLKENVIRQEVMIQLINEAFADFDKMAQTGEFSNQKASMTVADIVPKIQDIYNHTIIFFDTETTGLVPKYNQLTEIGAICVVPQLGGRTKVVENFNLLVTLSDYIQRRAEKEEREKAAAEAAGGKFKWGKTTKEILTMTNYYTNLEKVDVVSEKEAIAQFNKFVEDMKQKYNKPVLLIAHNAPFDMKFINVRAEKMRTPRIARHRVMDSLQFIYDYYYPMMIANGAMEQDPSNEPLMTKLKSGELSKTKYGTPKMSFRLGNLSTKFNINAENWHTAIADVEMLMKVMDQMVFEIFERKDEMELRTGYEQAQGAMPDWSKKKDPEASKTRKDLAAARALASPDVGVLDKPGRGYATGYELEPEKKRTGEITPPSEKTLKKKARKAAEQSGAVQSGSRRG